MPEILTESFCERCGTRYTFEAAEPKGKRLGKLKVFSKGFVNFVTNDESSLDEAFAEARSDEQRELTNQQLDAFHQTFQFCMSCRQYTCANCWNETESRCLSCAPLLGADLLDATQPALDPLARIFGETAEPAAANGHANGIGLIGTNGHVDDPGSAWPTADMHVEASEEATTLPALGAGPTMADVAPPADVPAAGLVAAEEPPSHEVVEAEAAPETGAVAADAEAGTEAEAEAEAGEVGSEVEPIDDDVARAVAAAEIARRAAAEAEHQREIAAEAERAREAAAQLEAERLRQAEEERARQAAEAEARTRAEQELAAQAAAADADRERQAEADAERDRLVREEAERQLAADVERQRQAQADAERDRLVREEAERQLAADVERQRQAQADAERAAAEAAQPPARDDRIETPTWQIVAPEQPEPGAGPLDVGPTILAPQPPLPARPAATNGAAQASNGSAPAGAAPTGRARERPSPPQWPMPVVPQPATDLWAASSQDVVNRPGGGVQACVSCGLSLSASARFCRRCGTQQH